MKKFPPKTSDRSDVEDPPEGATCWSEVATVGQSSFLFLPPPESTACVESLHHLSANETRFTLKTEVKINCSKYCPSTFPTQAADGGNQVGGCRLLKVCQLKQAMFACTKTFNSLVEEHAVKKGSCCCCYIGGKLENILNKLLKKRTVHVLHQIRVCMSDHWRTLQHTFWCFWTKTRHAAGRVKSFRKGHVTCRLLLIKRRLLSLLKETAFSFVLYKILDILSHLPGSVLMHGWQTATSLFFLIKWKQFSIETDCHFILF